MCVVCAELPDVMESHFGECAVGTSRNVEIIGGLNVSWSLAIAFFCCCLLTSCMPLRVPIRSMKTLTMTSAGVMVDCVMYLCLKKMVSERQVLHTALMKILCL